MKDLFIILDANFLMIPENHNVDIFSELDRVVNRKYKMVVPEVVIEELEHLSEKGSLQERKAARIALDISSKAEKIPSEKSDADQEIIRLAQKKGYSVATDDSDLRKRLRKRGIPVIFLRQGTYLSIDGKV